MNDFTAIEIKQITKLVNGSIPFSELRFPYLNEYEEFNKLILKKAQDGENSIGFDFIDYPLNETESLFDIKNNHYRIYADNNGGQASYKVYDYPNYLISRGFNVEIRKSVGSHGYSTNSYFISW